MSQFRLRKPEKLKSEQAINELFTNGKKVNLYPILFIYGKLSHRPIANRALPTIQCAFTVSKRRFRRATDRNRIKRLMRESYRLQKNKLLEAYSSQSNQHTLGLILIYIGKEIPEFDSVNNSINRFIVKHTSQ